ncbi:unnamed protein product [Durusdinium trenchii]|uniref:Uncharacterized protein n=2 Tax=Durusdinium trenchii TaxID=1381693 RepID=A0ABP0RR56_9DINO
MLIKLLVGLFSCSLASEVDPVLVRDDECAVGDEKCSLQALQLKGMKLATLEQEECTGSANLPTDSDLCYEGNLLVETFKVQVLQSTGTSGSLDMEAVGPLSGKCEGVSFQMEATQLSASNLDSCGINGAEYNVKYCSDQDEFVVQITKPMQLDVTLKRTSCTGMFGVTPPSLVSAPVVPLKPSLLATGTECTGTGKLPTTKKCYEGNLLVETFKVELLESDGTSGSLDMEAIGPLSGKCEGVSFQMDGMQLSASNLASCGITGAEYDVKYCSDQDEFVVQITKPMQLDVVLQSHACAASLAAVAPPVVAIPPAALVAQEEQRFCSGAGSLPKGTSCYRGSWLVEDFYVKVKSYSSTSGRVDVTASGPKKGHCYGVSYRKSGQNIYLNYAKCGFNNLSFSVQYCSNQNAVKVHISAPVIGDVMLSRSGC